MPVDAMLLPCAIAGFDNSMSQQSTKPGPEDLEIKSVNIRNESIL